MILEFAKKLIKRDLRREIDYLVNPSFEAKESVMIFVSPARTAVDVLDAGANSNVGGTISNIDENWNLKVAVGVNVVNKETIESHLQ